MSVSCFYSWFLPKCHQLTWVCASKEFFKLLLSFTSASTQTVESVEAGGSPASVWWCETPALNTSTPRIPDCLQQMFTSSQARGSSGQQGQRSPYRVWAVGRCSLPFTLSQPREGSGWPLPALTCRQTQQLTHSCVSRDSSISRGRSS